jgi:geranylgeranyl reductase family protein
MGGNSFDVIVIGAGPAGSMTAYLLAKAGVRTALIDASTFPRAKACGGGLQARALLEIPYDVSHLFRGTLSQISMSFGLRDFWTRTYSEPLVYSILRTEFDHFLLRQAERAGAFVFEASPLRGLEIPEHGPVSARLDLGELRAQCLVGADGANSVVRAFLNQRRDYFWQAAVYCEIPEELVDRQAYRPECMIADWGTLPSGYAWIFPKRGYVNIGAGGPVGIARHLRAYVMAFVRATGLLRSGAPEQLNLRGHHLPTLTGKTRLAAKRIVLVGDAAGVVEPFTGDGISFACHSARIAAECISGGLNSGSLDLTGYGSLIDRQIGAELFWARSLMSFSATFPRLIYRLFKSNDRVWETFCRTLRGEASFRRLKKDILGPFEFAWKAVDLFTGFGERNILAPRTLIRHSREVV